jgi:hypothetical protein
VSDSFVPLHGGCLCGGVRFELTRAPLSAGYCHCTRCQRRTGTGSSVQARVEGSAVRIQQGADLLRWWRHPEGGFEKGFCGACGGQLFSRNPDDAEQMSVRLGAFDGDTRHPPQLPRPRRYRGGVGADPRRRPRALRGPDAAL